MKYKINGSIKRNYGGGGSSTTSSIPDWAQPYLEKVGTAAQDKYGSGDLSKVAEASNLQKKAFGIGADSIIDAAGVARTGITNATTAGFNTMLNQGKRLEGLAGTGGYNTKALKDAAILEAGMDTAKLGREYGAGGTLASGRQAVMQGAQNASTAAKFSEIDRNAAQQTFLNKMAAEKGLAESTMGGTSMVNAGAKSLTDIIGNATGQVANLGNQERGIEQQKLDSTWQGLQRYASTIYGNPARQSATGGK